MSRSLALLAILAALVNGCWVFTHDPESRPAVTTTTSGNIEAANDGGVDEAEAEAQDARAK